MKVIVTILLLMLVLNVCVLLLTLGFRAARQLYSLWQGRVRSRCEEAVADYLRGDEVPPALRAHRPWERDVLSSVLIHHMMMLRGSDRERLRRLAEHLGLQSHYLRELRSRRRWRRARAAENLGYFGDSSTVARLRPLLGDPDETVRAVAARALARLGGEEAAEALARALADPSELTSLRVAENLQRLGHVAVPYLVSALGSGSRRAQVLAARILGELRAEEGRGALRHAATFGQDENVRAQAVLALGKIGHPDDLELIVRCARDRDWPVRAQAANALRMIGDTSTIPLLREMLRDPEWWVRLNASRALAAMGPMGERALADALWDDDRYARDRAAATLESEGVLRRLVVRARSSAEARGLLERIVEGLRATGNTGYLRRLLEEGEGGDGMARLRERLAGSSSGRLRVEEER